MIFTLALRHLKIYFRDKATVFFSLLSVFIIIGLYVLFLGDLTDQPDIPGYRNMMDQWIMSGVVAVGGFTTTLGAYGIIVDDKSKKIERDFIVSPISPAVRVLAYLLGTIVIGVIMSVITLIFAQVYIFIYGGPFIGILNILKLIGLILLNVICASSILFFIINFVKTSNAFAIISTLVGTLMGFLMGIYVPIGNLPKAVQIVIMCFPPAHAGTLFRNVMMKEQMDKVFAGAPVEKINEMKEFLGVTFKIGDMVIPPYISLLVLVGTTLVFFGLSIIFIRMKKKS